jgi:tetratricopeptide (TPR) repeat protein
MRMRELLAAAAIVAATAVAYVPAMRGAFVWDDDQHVVQSDQLGSLRGLARIWFVPGTIPQYYPLVHTTFWIESRLWGLHPFGYHLVNVLLHATVALLFCGLLRRLNVPGAWFAGAIFALHPVHVESVAWVSERKNVLSGLFYLLAIRSYLRYAPPEEERPEGLRHYIASALLFLCALLAKTVTATLPVALLLIRWWKRGRITRRDILPLVPFFAMGIILSGVTVWMERHHVGAEGAAWDLSAVQRLIIAGRALFFYLSKLIFPARLTFIYPRWPIPASLAYLAYPIAACIGIAILWLSRRRIGRGVVTAALFFVATLVPALGFFNVFPMRYSFVADHFQYLASLGPIALVGALIARVGRGQGTDRASVRTAGLLRAATGCAFLVLPATVTWVHAGVFRNAETLWRDTIAKNPGSWMAQHNLGLVYENEGRLDSAVAQYRRAIAIEASLETSHYNLATLLVKQGKLDEGQKEFEEALRIRPDYVDAWNNLGNVFHSRGDLAGSVIRYRRALACDAGYLPARKNLAYALGELGRAREAIAEYREAARLSEDDVSVLNNLAWLLVTAPNPADRNAGEALRLSERACALTGNADASCLRTLAAAYQLSGRSAEAAAAASKAASLPHSPSAQPPAAR